MYLNYVNYLHHVFIFGFNYLNRGKVLELLFFIIWTPKFQNTKSNGILLYQIRNSAIKNKLK